MGIWVKVGVSDLGTIAGNVIGYPYQVNGVEFGTKDNPLYKVTETLGTDRKWRYVNLYTTETTSVVTDFWDSLDSYWPNPDYKFSLYYGDVYSGFSTTYENRTISGKYRIPSNAGSLVAKVFVPVEMAIDGVVYRGIYSDVQKPGETPEFCLYGGTKFMSNSGVIVSNFRNKVIDFGVIPQNVPSFFYDYIVNSFNRIYENTYAIKSQNGFETLGTIIEAPNMKKALLNVIGNIKTLTLTGENDQEYTVTWDSETPDGKVFNGLSFTKNGKVANIGIGVETEINLTGSATFYEVYSTYRPPVTTFDINLYNNTAESNRVDKTNYLTAVGTLSGVLRSESSITDMSLIFESENVPNFNYVYIASFNRYYFVNDISSIRYKLWEMSISVDPLMTYKEAILSCVGFIDRNENESNPNIVDKNRVIEQGHTIQTEAVTNELFTTTSGTYVLNGLLLNTYSKPVQESEVQNAE